MGELNTEQMFSSNIELLPPLLLPPDKSQINTLFCCLISHHPVSVLNYRPSAVACRIHTPHCCFHIPYFLADYSPFNSMLYPNSVLHQIGLFQCIWQEIKSFKQMKPQFGKPCRVEGESCLANWIMNHSSSSMCPQFPCVRFMTTSLNLVSMHF